MNDIFIKTKQPDLTGCFWLNPLFFYLTGQKTIGIKIANSAGHVNNKKRHNLFEAFFVILFHFYFHFHSGR